MVGLVSVINEVVEEEEPAYDVSEQQGEVFASYESDNRLFPDRLDRLINSLISDLNSLANSLITALRIGRRANRGNRKDTRFFLFEKQSVWIFPMGLVS